MSSGKGNKCKSKQIGLHQTKKILPSVGNNQQNEKVAYWMRENIHRFNIQNRWRTHATHTTQHHKNKQLNRKMGQQAHEKKLNITHHQGNANQNLNELSFHTCQKGSYQKDNK